MTTDPPTGPEPDPQVEPVPTPPPPSLIPPLPSPAVGPSPPPPLPLAGGALGVPPYPPAPWTPPPPPPPVQGYPAVPPPSYLPPPPPPGIPPGYPPPPPVGYPPSGPVPPPYGYGHHGGYAYPAGTYVRPSPGPGRWIALGCGVLALLFLLLTLLGMQALRGLSLGSFPVYPGAVQSDIKVDNSGGAMHEERTWTTAADPGVVEGWYRSHIDTPDWQVDPTDTTPGSIRFHRRTGNPGFGTVQILSTASGTQIVVDFTG